MTSAEERMQNVYDQVKAVDSGEANAIICPYCGKINHPQTEFCCDLFAKSSVAALERLRVEQAREQVERIQERHSRN